MPQPNVQHGGRDPASHGSESQLHDSGLNNRKIDNDSTNPIPLILYMSTTDPNKPMKNVSPFVIERYFRTNPPQPAKVTRLRSGDLIIEAKDTRHAKQLLQTKRMFEIPVSINGHRSMNRSKGIVRCREFEHLTEEEIIQGLEEYHVTEVVRLTTRRDGRQINTNTYKLTFETPTPPPHIVVLWQRYAVEVFIPSPLRCFHCQRFGHHKSVCRSRPMCPNCGSSDHTADCREKSCCPNCKGDHPAYASTCPTWQFEKEVQRIRTLKKIPLSEARKEAIAAKPHHPQNAYANALKGGSKTSAVKTKDQGTQVEFPTILTASHSVSPPVYPNPKRPRMTSTGTQPSKVLVKSGSYPNIASMHAEQSSFVNAKSHNGDPTKRELKPQPPPRSHKTPPLERASQTLAQKNLISQEAEKTSRENKPKQPPSTQQSKPTTANKNRERQPVKPPDKK